MTCDRGCVVIGPRVIVKINCPKWTAAGRSGATSRPPILLLLLHLLTAQTGPLRPLRPCPHTLRRPSDTLELYRSSSTGRTALRCPFPPTAARISGLRSSPCPPRSAAAFSVTWPRHLFRRLDIRLGLARLHQHMRRCPYYSLPRLRAVTLLKTSVAATLERRRMRLWVACASAYGFRVRQGSLVEDPPPQQRVVRLVNVRTEARGGSSKEPESHTGLAYRCNFATML